MSQAIHSEAYIWTERDEILGLRQGWFIQCGCVGSRIRALKPGGNFSCDTAAVAFVAARALRGDDLARRAVAFLVQEHGLEDTVGAGVPPADPSGFPEIRRRQHEAMKAAEASL